jgi:oligoribonuclease NrnB/cAMP/cGMP phosphodiesterase (DHH superfamily)
MQQLVRNFRTMKLAGHEVPVVNCNAKYASDVGNALAVQLGKFGVTCFDTAKERVFSLRSTDETLDVSAIAKMFGNGGHRNASGFSVPRFHELAMK